jgi:hypothetical protein
MSYREHNENVSVHDFSQDVEVHVSGSASKSIDGLLHKVISSHQGEVNTEDIVREAMELAEFSSEEKIQRHDIKLAQDFRRRIGALKSKGVHRIIEALNDQMEFSIQLGENTLVTIDAETVIPLDRAKKSHFRMHRAFHHSKRMAQIEGLKTADETERRSIGYIEQNINDDQDLRDYDNGEGLAVI